MFNLITKMSCLLFKPSILSTFLLGVLVPSAQFSLPAEAQVESSRFFVQAPRLVEATATDITPSVPSTYRFVIAIPEAGEPLQAVRIVQKPNLEDIRFEIGESRASLDNGIGEDQDLYVASVGGEESDKGEVAVVFDEPVPPGSTVTISVRGINPSSGGIYQFGGQPFPLEKVTLVFA